MDWLNRIFGFDSLGALLTNAIGEWLAGLVNQLFAAIDVWLAGLLDTVFYVEQLVSMPGSTYFTAEGIRNTYLFIYAFCCSLMVLKFLYKGFNVYVLWRDGDADVSPQSMLIGAGQALFVMAAFPLLYDYLADISIYFANGIITNFGSYGNIHPNIFLELATQGLLLIIIAVVYAIMVLVLWLHLLARGFEVLLLRLGLPLACIGLVDSDGGIFHGYIQIFIKTVLTTIIQIFLFSLSLKVMTSLSFMNAIAGIALLIAAFRTPILLQNILVQAKGSGSGITGKIYSGSMAIRGIRSAIGK